MLVCDSCTKPGIGIKSVDVRVTQSGPAVGMNVKDNYQRNMDLCTQCYKDFIEKISLTVGTTLNKKEETDAPSSSIP